MEKKSVGLLELEMAVLECFLEKTPLSPLGVNMIAIQLVAIVFHSFAKDKGQAIEFQSTFL
jgi:hypothetical protein